MLMYFKVIILVIIIFIIDVYMYNILQVNCILQVVCNHGCDRYMIQLQCIQLQAGMAQSKNQQMILNRCFILVD